MIVFQFVAA